MPTTLYLLPGLLCDARVWAHQQAHLADLVDIRIPDYRQFDSFDAMADSVLTSAPDRFMLAGHSMGARVAMQILHKAPTRVSRLGLLDTGVHPPGSGETAKRQVFLDLAAREGMGALGRAWGPPMVHPDRHGDDAFMGEIYDMVESYTYDHFHNQIRALLGRPDAEPFLRQAPPGSLVLCGREDSWSPPAQHEAIIAALPDDPPLVIIEHSGHMSTMEQPEAVTAAMRQWLERSLVD